jgi:hypothetical protein
MVDAVEACCFVFIAVAFGLELCETGFDHGPLTLVVVVPEYWMSDKIDVIVLAPTDRVSFQQIFYSFSLGDKLLDPLLVSWVNL